MKSVLITFLMFIVVFSLIKLGAIDIIDSTVFHIIVFAAFIIVIICAVYFVGLPFSNDSADGQKPNIQEDKIKKVKKNENK